MPELPEVETILRGVRPHLLGRKVLEISHSGKDLRQPVPMVVLRNNLLGSEIVDVRRRAKYLLVCFSNHCIMTIHLGMTGNLGIFSSDIIPSPHCHLRFRLDNDRELRYTDIRRFGSVQLIEPEETASMEETFFATTGPEPFAESFNADSLFKAAQSRSIGVKTFIMTNSIVAGVGNIYANESLHRAKIAPARKACSLTRKNWAKLVTAIREVLEHAIECGGSTISDYVNADQESGYFQINFQVYGREGEPCHSCGTPINKQQLAGRASYHCPSCQR